MQDDGNHVELVSIQSFQYIIYAVRCQVYCQVSRQDSSGAVRLIGVLPFDTNTRRFAGRAEPYRRQGAIHGPGFFFIRHLIPSGRLTRPGTFHFVRHQTAFGRAV